MSNLIEDKSSNNIHSMELKEIDACFNFKQEILEFNTINKLLLVEFSMEYHNLRETFEKKWIQLLKKVDSFAK